MDVMLSHNNVSTHIENVSSIDTKKNKKNKSNSSTQFDTFVW